jgi:glycosyltransferase involved in cell wall biosynthesis
MHESRTQVILLDSDASEAPLTLMADPQDYSPAPRTLLSVVLPAFNEEQVLPQAYQRLTRACQDLPFSADYELVFVNDGSADRTAEVLDRFSDSDPRVRAVHLTRNFGHQAAVSAGMSVARGDAVVVMDCDLQDPPELLPSFLNKWKEGFQVVYAVRKARKEWLGKRLAYWAFYRLLGAISELPIPLDSGDFCLMDRHAVTLLNSLPERQRFVRGLRAWIGLKQTSLPYERDARQAGAPAYTMKALIRLAMDGLVSFSSVPLRWVTRLGILSAFGAVALGIFVIVARTVFGSDRFPWGWSSTACLILLSSSIQLLSLGIIGEYLARIFLEVKGRPTFLIARIAGGKVQRAAVAPIRAEARTPFYWTVEDHPSPTAAELDDMDEPQPEGVR